MLPIMRCALFNPLAQYVKANKYGVVGDGVTDDKAALQNAANAARDAGKPLYIPKGNYFIGSELLLYTSVKCDGKIIVANGGGYVTIARTVSGVGLTETELSGLTKGSTTITGLAGYEGGTLKLVSTEVLIKRWDGDNQVWYADPYYLRDTCKITNASGGIYPALDCTYTDMAKLTATVYPYEKPITITGLYVEASGDVAASGYGYIQCKRSNVTFESPKAINLAGVGYRAECGIYTEYCTDLIFNNPVLTNVYEYGISLDYVSNVTINNGNITGSREAITGRSNKRTFVYGGYYDDVIDSHWGNVFVIDGAQIGKKVQYAGTDITIQNCTYFAGEQILKIRDDTPEIMGDIILDNISIARGDVYDLQGLFNVNLYDYGDFGRTIGVPDSITITDITATNMTDDSHIFYVYTTPYRLDVNNVVAALPSPTISGISATPATVVNTRTADVLTGFMSNLINDANCAEITAGNWYVWNGTHAVANNVLTNRVNTSNSNYGSTEYAYASNKGLNITDGHKYYCRVSARITDTAVATQTLTAKLATGSATPQTIKTVTSPTQNEWQVLSAIVTWAGGYNTETPIMTIAQGYPAIADATGKYMEIKQLMLIDLTQDYGAGSEPNVATCDGWAFFARLKEIV